MWTIAEIKTTPSLELFSQLVDLLQDAVQSGASVGFLSPLSTADARNYWMASLAEVARGDRVVLLATDGTHGHRLRPVDADLAHQCASSRRRAEAAGA